MDPQLFNYDRSSFTELLDKMKEQGFQPQTYKILSLGEEMKLDDRLQDALKLNWKVDIIEGFKQHVEWLNIHYPQINTFEYNYKNIGSIPNLKLQDYDIVWWSHGPEHLTKVEAEPLMKYFINVVPFVFVSAPHGNHPLINNFNVLASHKSSWYPVDFNKYNGHVYVETLTPDTQTVLDVFIKGTPRE